MPRSFCGPPLRGYWLLGVSRLLASALVQKDTRLAPVRFGGVRHRGGAAHRGSAGIAGHHAHSAGSLSNHSVPLPFDCKRAPFMCRAPFNCHTANLYDVYPKATQQGHANLRSWCTQPHGLADTVVKYCLVQKNPRRAAHELYDWHVDQRTDEKDASYCFQEGHCTNEQMTDNSTVRDGEQMCNDRYGVQGWTGDVFAEDGMVAGLNVFRDFTWGENTFDADKGFENKKITRYFAKMACVMGNFHCDVAYCKHTYCKNPYYMRKYEHLLPAIKGHLIREVPAQVQMTFR